MSSSQSLSGPRLGEFVTLAALMTSLVALSIDAMLPALADIGADLEVAHDNDRQLVVAMLFLGLAIGQVIYGPLSDSFGRKRPIYAGFVIFIAGCLLSAFATDYTTMLVGRLLQGLGAAGPRIVVIAMVRDLYEGRAMARIMSIVMAVFILVPALAPAMGQGILVLSHWRVIFGLLFVLAVVALTWFALRQPETLQAERRRPFTWQTVYGAIHECCASRVAMGYTVAGGLVFGAFVGYLTSSQQIFQELYGLGHLFPLYFGVLALAIGAAGLFNAKLVMRYGMRPLSRVALIILTILTGAFAAYVLLSAPTAPFWLFMGVMIVGFFCIGILFGNFNALAMAPLGHIAGVAAAVVGSGTTFISFAVGTAIGALYDGTVLPLVVGFAGLGLLALLAMAWAESGRPEAEAEDEGADDVADKDGDDTVPSN
ncbi:MAG: multidrug effflux MFS transporter [Pseudomonadota bacterium]